MAIRIKKLQNNKRTRVFYSDKNMFIKRPGGTLLHKYIPYIGPTKERYIETDIEIPTVSETKSETVTE